MIDQDLYVIDESMYFSWYDLLVSDIKDDNLIYHHDVINNSYEINQIICHPDVLYNLNLKYYWPIKMKEG